VNLIELIEQRTNCMGVRYDATARPVAMITSLASLSSQRAPWRPSLRCRHAREELESPAAASPALRWPLAKTIFRNHLQKETKSLLSVIG
jgi:hypothetical protein